jgi:hypothetical protein
MSSAATFAPSWVSRTAQARPIPEAAPVTTAFVPLRLMLEPP